MTAATPIAVKTAAITDFRPPKQFGIFFVIWNKCSKFATEIERKR